MLTKTKKSTKDGSSKPPPMLPPCRVCGERASGLHYGVNTCEACKAFFRRSLQRGNVYKCTEGNNCSILPGKRSSCSACRFNKCCNLGMCKEAIKTGRYTHEKRTEDIMEVKRLSQQLLLQQHQQQQVSSEQPQQSFSPQLISPPPSASYNSPVIENMDVEMKPQQLNDSFSLTNIDAINNNVAINNNNYCNNHYGNNLHDNNNKELIYNSYNDDFVPDEKLTEIITNISQTYMKDTLFNEEFFEQLPQRQKDYLERKALQNEVFGPLKPLSKDEYNRIYQTTGIDLDGRKEHILEELPHLEKAIKKYISFAKTIPGFNELSIDDQIALIKASKFEAWMIFCHKLFNIEYRLYTEQSGRIVHIDDMKKVNNGEFLDAMFRLEGNLQKMGLSHEETCIMAAICVMFTDNCELQNARLVEGSQNLLMKCLFYLFRKHHPDDNLRFAHFISCVLQMRTLKEIHTKEEEVFVMEWGNKVEIPKLVYEIWSS